MRKNEKIEIQKILSFIYRTAITSLLLIGALLIFIAEGGYLYAQEILPGVPSKHLGSTGIELGTLGVASVSCILTLVITFFGNKALKKLSSRDCTDCVPVTEIKEDIKSMKEEATNVKVIILRIATAVKADIRDYEHLVK